MGYGRGDADSGQETLKKASQHPENDYMRGLVYSFAEKWPEKSIRV
jgi:hypothetical protein